MPPPDTKPLTDRQRAVMERVDRRVPIKVIAQELSVSETRINQHIRALKDIFGAASLGELVELYRASLTDIDAEDSSKLEQFYLGGMATSSVHYVTASAFPMQIADTNARISISTTSPQKQVKSSSGVQIVSDNHSGDSKGLGGTLINGILPVVENAPWFEKSEPNILNGEHAIVLRLGAIVVIALLFLASLTLTSALAGSIEKAVGAEPAISAGAADGALEDARAANNTILPGLNGKF